MTPIFSNRKSYPSNETPETGQVQEKFFESRPLAKPSEDLEDQGLAFDLGTLMNRRLALGLAGAGAGSIFLASTSRAEASSTGKEETTAEMPTETAGPYPGDGSNGPDVLEESGINRADLRYSLGSDVKVDGVELTIKLRILDVLNNDQPFAGVAVYLWHCSADGKYSMYSDGVTDQTWLRGVQVADSQGRVEFKSIVPGCYSGRWPHLHFEVFPSLSDIVDAQNAILTSQIIIPQDAVSETYTLDAYTGSQENLDQITLETDMVFADSWQQQMPTLSGSVKDGYTVEIDIPVDSQNSPTVIVGGEEEQPGGPGTGSGTDSGDSTDNGDGSDDSGDKAGCATPTPPADKGTREGKAGKQRRR